jgi:hypothetical protein
MGLALLSIGFHDKDLVTRVVAQAAVALIAGGVWSMRVRATLQTSDLAKVGEGYRRHRELAASHAVFVVLAAPLPGTPGGQVWMGILGQSVASGTGLGLVVVAGVILVYCALFRSVTKAASQFRSSHDGCTQLPS